MADVFEKEGSPTQDATYREHLDRNWEAGNKKFVELEKQEEERIKALETQVAHLNLAVFGDGAVPIDTPIDSNNQTNKAQEVHLD
ncbi:hypothetical protein HMPREF5175_00916 [Lactobacillus gasseri SV-16A-US]|uniref:Uncharacterized protein n=2 Tax=Lactobacillus gasseri TaxID=1596 RepID=D1YH02_LACGS|nr:hypothetical protein [Lactobacillus gasseri]EFB62885.1 hypothetical protein HMPREF9209_0355 [Lactobacillus gasseri 224-1]KFL98074.1 hypothetical protein HMPREF5175_00916 [Lactobacillus gasseri SV-16A-US]